MDDLAGYREQTAQMDRGTFLGRLCWYTVAESNVQHTDLAQQMTASGLETYIPRPPRDDDVFRRVFHNGQRKKIETDDADVIVNYLIRELSRSDGRIVKRVVVEKVDRKGRRLDYHEALEVVFDSERPGKVSIASIGDVFDPTAVVLVSELAEKYRAARGTVNGQGVRDVLRRILEVAMATAVRPGGGVYFVMEDRSDLVAAVEQLGDAIPGCDVHSLELIDTNKQRDMLRKAFEAESVDEIDRMMAEIAAIADDETVTPARAAAYAKKAADLKAKTAEYSTLLSQSLSTTEFRLRLFDNHLAQLHGRVTTTERRRKSA